MDISLVLYIIPENLNIFIQEMTLGKDTLFQ